MTAPHYAPVAISWLKVLFVLLAVGLAFAVMVGWITDLKTGFGLAIVAAAVASALP